VGAGVDVGLGLGVTGASTSAAHAGATASPDAGSVQRSSRSDNPSRPASASGYRVAAVAQADRLPQALIVVSTLQGDATGSPTVAVATGYPGTAEAMADGADRACATILKASSHAASGGSTPSGGADCACACAPRLDTASAAANAIGRVLRDAR
jgi:hypothetical protein